MAKCSLVETTFLLLVTVSTVNRIYRPLGLVYLSFFKVNFLSVVLNAAPITPEEDEDFINLTKDNPQCMTFVLFMIW